METGSFTLNARLRHGGGEMCFFSPKTKTSRYENRTGSSRTEIVKEIGQNDLDEFQPISFLIEENFQFITKQSGASKFGVER